MLDNGMIYYLLLNMCMNKNRVVEIEEGILGILFMNK